MKPATVVITPFKVWKMNLAESLGLKLSAVNMRLHRGKLPLPPHCQYGSTGRIINVITKIPQPPKP